MPAGSSARAEPWPYQVKRAAASWLNAYAQIYFANRPLPGLLFVLATFMSPQHGLLGFSGLVFANLWARLLERPREHIDEGFYGFNGLLTALAIGLYFRLSLHLVAVILISTFLIVVVASALRNLSERYIGLPVLSLPFVLVTWIVLLATRRFSALEFNIEAALTPGLGAGFLPQTVELYARSLAAAFFQIGVLPGVLVFLGLLLYSRWSILLSVIGFAVGYSVYSGLGGAPSDLYAEFIGFNFILTAIAVGGVWIVLKPASMLFAAAGGALSAVMSAALLTTCATLGLPVLAMPFIVTTQILLFMVIIRTTDGRLKIVRGEWDSPERNLGRALYRERRYPDPAVPVFFLPVMGKWTVTQGPGGELTHQGLWTHAWDFEVTGEDGLTYRNGGRRLEDYLAYGAPVVAPGEGKVVRVVSHLEDQPLGDVDTANSWGNLVIMWHSGDIYSALCHLQKGSISVNEGEAVTAGQVIGRVGNSGRSPSPHLHFQLQASWEIGAPTLYGELIHYLTLDGDEKQYVTHGVPGEKAEIRAVEVDDFVRQAVTLAPGREWKWVINENGKRREERWKSEIDALGNRRLVDDSGKASVQFFSDGHYTTMLDYEGPSKRLLGLFYLGALRIPYLRESLVSWTDMPSVTAFMPVTTRLIHDLILPFHANSAVITRSSLARKGDRLVMTTTFENGSRLIPSMGLPERIEIEFQPGVGPIAVSAFLDEKEILSGELAR